MAPVPDAQTYLVASGSICKGSHACISVVCFSFALVCAVDRKPKAAEDVPSESEQGRPDFCKVFPIIAILGGAQW